MTVNSNTDILPDELEYGFVADRVLLAIGNTHNDDDRYPDGVPADGKVVFTPIINNRFTTEDPATVLQFPIECTIHQKDEDPKRVGLLVGPAGFVGNVSLVVGQYEVAYKLQVGTVSKFRFWVRPENTVDNPVWLPLVAPLVPDPSVKFVVNEQIYTDSLAARDEAEGFRDEVVTYHGQTVTLVNRAETAAQSAETARDETLALGASVDDSVGHRVFIGDTMIHGDTGWREISSLLTDPELWVYDNSSQKMVIRRLGDTVHLQAYMSRSLVESPVKNSLKLLDVPMGFSFTGFSVRGFASSFGSTIGVLKVMNAFSTRAYQIIGVDLEYLMAPGESLSTQASWVTSDDWPTELPGIPA